jgi:Uma2 family endonuclease
VSVQNPVRLSDDTEPQPDLAVLRWQDDDYAARIPSASDVLLLIEVSESSSGYDRNEKLPRYAHANIAEVWLVDLVNEVVEQYSNPRGDQYGAKQTIEAGQTIRGQNLAVELAVREIFPQ